MASSDTEIANLAISHLGVAKEISSLTDDRSTEALACRRFYSTAKRQVLRAINWTFAKEYRALGLVTLDPSTEWGFSYQYPSDCVMIRKIMSGIRNDTRQSRVPYEIKRGTSGKVIWTDQEDAIAKFTLDEDSVGFYPDDFVMAFSALLAWYIAPRLTSGDPFKIRPEIFQMYKDMISMASANNFNEQQDEEEPDSEFTRVRG